MDEIKSQIVAEVILLFFFLTFQRILESVFGEQ